jgi:hypothetical protein
LSLLINNNIMRDTKIYTLFTDNDGSSAAFTAATTDIITSNAHGLSNDDPVILTTSDTLPAGLSLTTVYYVAQATTNTFKLSKGTGGGEILDITDTGTGTHTWTDSTLSNVVFADGRHCALTLIPSGTVAMTVTLVGSNQETAPNFAAASSATNHYDTIQSIDLQNGDPADGDSGLSGAALAAAATTQYAMNADLMRWVGLKLSHTTGTLNAKAAVAID